LEPAGGTKMCTSKLSDCRGRRLGESGLAKAGYTKAVMSVESVRSVLSVRRSWPLSHHWFRVLSFEFQISNFYFRVRFYFRIRRTWSFGPPRCGKNDAPEPGWAVENSGWLSESPTGSRTGPYADTAWKEHLWGQKPDILILRRAGSGLRTRWRRVSAAIRNRLSGRRRPPFTVLHSILVVKPMISFNRQNRLNRPHWHNRTRWRLHPDERSSENLGVPPRRWMPFFSCQKSTTRVKGVPTSGQAAIWTEEWFEKIYSEILRQPLNVINFSALGSYTIASMRKKEIKAQCIRSGASTMPNDRMVRSTRGNTANAQR